MGKNIAAGVAGILVAVALVWIIESTGHAVYPPPPALDFSDPDAMRSYIASLPPGAFLFVGGAWFFGTLGGTITACRIGSAKPRTFAIIIGGIMALAALSNLILIPHPLWFSVSGIAGIIVAAWLGMAVGKGNASGGE